MGRKWQKYFRICGLGLFLFYSSAIILSGQVIEVYDQETNEPLAYANVTTKNEYAGVTNQAGQLDISRWTSVDTVTISSMGYTTQSIEVDVTKEKTYKVYMRTSEEIIDMIMVSANRWAEKRGDVPNQVISIDPEQILLDNPQTAADLLTSSGQVYVQKSQLGGGSPILRGFSTSRVLLVVDGVRMNNAIFRSGNVQNVISIDPQSVASTEVSFGPGSVMYGSDAIGGVMHFRTLSPTFGNLDKTEIDGKAYTRVSSANREKMGHLHASFKSRNWSALSSVSYSDYGDLRMGSDGPDDYLRSFYVERESGRDVSIDNPDPEVQRSSGYSQINLMQKIRFTPDRNQFFTYGVYYSKTSDVPRYDRLIWTDGNQPRYGEWYYGPQEWLFQQFNYHTYSQHTLADEIDVTLAHQKYGESRVTRNFNAVERITRAEDLDIFSLNIDLKKQIGGWTWYYGTEWVYNDVESMGSMLDLNTDVRSPATDRYPQAIWQSLGAYLTSKKWLSDTWLLQIGGRWNLYDIEADFSQSDLDLPFTETDLGFHTFSGNLGLKHRITSHNQLAINLSTGARAPNVDDIGKVFDSAPGSVVVPNPDLRSEVAYNAELNYLQSLGNRSAIEASVYYTYLDNAMVRRNYTLNGRDSMVYDGAQSVVQAIQNAANAYVAGIQLGIRSVITGPWSILANFNYQVGDEELENGETSRSRHVVPMFGNVQLSYETSKWQLVSGLRFQGQMSAADLPVSEQDKPYLYAANEAGMSYAPAWGVWNLRFTYTPIDKLQLSGGIENIMDKRYRPYSSGIAGPGRNFILSLGYYF